MTSQQSYWEKFYGGQDHTRRPTPSQFAAFVQSELNRPCCIIDFGCGSGRDSLFFSEQGHKVLGVDGSAVAIQSCRDSAARFGLQAEFHNAAIGDAELPARLAAHRAEKADLVIYARFFLHAIDEATEDQLIQMCTQLCTAGDRLAFEFRTIRDASLTKVTPDHYRRFLEPTSLMAKLHHSGFAVDYYVEGFGFAKYKADDAYVARVVCSVEKR